MLFAFQRSKTFFFLKLVYCLLLIYFSLSRMSNFELAYIFTCRALYLWETIVNIHTSLNRTRLYIFFFSFHKRADVNGDFIKFVCAYVDFFFSKPNKLWFSRCWTIILYFTLQQLSFHCTRHFYPTWSKALCCMVVFAGYNCWRTGIIIEFSALFFLYLGNSIYAGFHVLR